MIAFGIIDLLCSVHRIASYTVPKGHISHWHCPESGPWPENHLMGERSGPKMPVFICSLDRSNSRPTFYSRRIQITAGARVCLWTLHLCCCGIGLDGCILMKASRLVECRTSNIRTE